MQSCLQLETAQIETEEQEMLVVIPVTDFVHMVNTFKQVTRENLCKGKVNGKFPRIKMQHLQRPLSQLCVLNF
jgi:hypothetical protein